MSKILNELISPSLKKNFFESIYQNRLKSFRKKFRTYLFSTTEVKLLLPISERTDFFFLKQQIQKK